MPVARSVAGIFFVFKKRKSFKINKLYMFVELPFFEPIDTTNLRSEYDATLDQDGKALHVCLIFEKKEIDATCLESIGQLLRNVDEFDQKFRATLTQNFAEGGMVRDYIDFHLGELPSELLDNFGIDPDTPDPGAQLLDGLYWHYLWVRPEQLNSYATVDYSLGPYATTYKAVIHLDSALRIVGLSMES
jgi:Protein of unknown function (DUF2004)